MSEDDTVAPELPSDYQELRRSYRWPLSYGLWALGIIGLIGVRLFADRPGEIALAGIGFGAAMVIAGVLLPRMHGQLELGPSGSSNLDQAASRGSSKVYRRHLWSRPR
jgi:hypothetical protein